MEIRGGEAEKSKPACLRPKHAAPGQPPALMALPLSMQRKQVLVNIEREFY